MARDIAGEGVAAERRPSPRRSVWLQQLMKARQPLPIDQPLRQGSGDRAARIVAVPAVAEPALAGQGAQLDEALDQLFAIVARHVELADPR